MRVQGVRFALRSKVFAAQNKVFQQETEHEEVQSGSTCHVLTMSCSSGFASLGFCCQSFLGLMWHDSTRIVIARKPTSHPRSCVSKSLSAHVLDALSEVALMSLLAIPAIYICQIL